MCISDVCTRRSSGRALGRSPHSSEPSLCPPSLKAYPLQPRIALSGTGHQPSCTSQMTYAPLSPAWSAKATMIGWSLAGRCVLVIASCHLAGHHAFEQRHSFCRSKVWMVDLTRISRTIRRAICHVETMGTTALQPIDTTSNIHGTSLNASLFPSP